MFVYSFIYLDILLTANLISEEELLASVISYPNKKASKENGIKTGHEKDGLIPANSIPARISIPTVVQYMSVYISFSYFSVSNYEQFKPLLTILYST